MDKILSLIGKVVYHLPESVKDRLDKLVFLDNPNNLPEPEPKTEPVWRDSYRSVALVLGGCSERPARALELYEQGIVSGILVSGGVSLRDDAQAMPEAVRDSHFLIEHGVSPMVIRAEVNSRTTMENMKNSLPMLVNQAKGRKEIKVVVVTNHFHLRRAILLFEATRRDLRSINPDADKLKLYWAAANFSITRKNWRNTKRGCAIVGKEAIRIMQLKIFGKG